MSDRTAQALGELKVQFELRVAGAKPLVRSNAKTDK